MKNLALNESWVSMPLRMMKCRFARGLLHNRRINLGKLMCASMLQFGEAEI